MTSLHFVPEDIELVNLIRSKIDESPGSKTIVLKGVGENIESINRVLAFCLKHGWKGEFSDTESDISDESGASYIELKKV